MKTLKDLTPEIVSKIQIYKDRCVKDLYSGKEYNDWKREYTVDYIEYIYKLANQKDKPVIIVADNLLEYKLFYNFIFNPEIKINKKFVKLINLIWLIKNNKINSKINSKFREKLNSKLDSELYWKLDSELTSEFSSKLASEFSLEFTSKLGLELDSKLYSEIRRELDSELNPELNSELNSELHSELDSELSLELYLGLNSELSSRLDWELHSELHSELYIKLREELCLELHSELHRELNSELHRELSSGLGSEFYEKLDSELDWELDLKLDSELRPELHRQLRRELDSELNLELNSELESKLNSKLNSELNRELDSKLRGELDSKLCLEVDLKLNSEIREELNSELYSEINSKFIKPKTHFLFLGGEYSRVYLMWYKFIKDEFGLKTSKEKELDYLYEMVNKANIAKCYFCEKVVLVLRMPQKINRNSRFLHCIDDGAIIYPNQKLYYLYGVKVSKSLVESLRNKTYIFEDFTKETNEEIKSAILNYFEEYYGGEYVYRFISSHLKEVDTYVHKKEEKYLEGTTKSSNIGVYTLFKGNVNNIDIAYVRCYCPSTDRMFFLGVNSEFKNAKDAIASLCQIPVSLKNNIVSITRCGEIYSFNFDEKGVKKIKNNKVDIEDVVSLTGDEYFSKLIWEY
jgi:hypothetical protein